MNINRDNYEEYFLLYADNELTDSEKVEVIMFLKQNRYLDEEFRMIHHTISKPDVSLELTDKSFLFRNNETSIINEKNYEKVFVLYHDKELTDKQRLETEAFLSVHPQLQNDFELIGLARLTPEAEILFPDKKLLYKKEKPGKVVPIFFWRMLAAAVFIGFGLWITQLYFQTKTITSSLSVNSIPSKENIPQIKKDVIQSKKSVPEVAQSLPQKSHQNLKETNEVKEKIQKHISPKNNNDIAVINKNNETKNVDQKNLINQVPDRINKNIVIGNPKTKSVVGEQITSINKIEPSNELTQNVIQKNNEKDEPAMQAQTVSYIQDANDNNQNYVFYDITTDDFKKTKVGGFLKKVKRVIERNNPISRLLSGDERQVLSN
jgi:hypothetical protein